MNHKLIQALQQFDIRITEILATSESAVFAPGEKGAEMIADTFVPIAWRLYSDIKRWIARQIAHQIGISIRSVRIDLKALRD